MKRQHLLGFTLLAAGTLGLFLTAAAPDGSQADDKKPAAEAAAAESADGQKPVETDMHEFMEYIYKPSYMRLREVMKTRPSFAKWRHVKAESLVMAECANLLLIRVPEENGDEWKKLSVESRELGAKLYAAGKKRDYDAAKMHYTAMIKNCNLCHKKFAGGEHQLVP